MGGIEPAKTMITEALKAGKNVVSANKDLIAEYGKELYDAAKEGSADFLFEAAVAGGIPIIRPLKQCLEGNQIDEIMGIVNGTTNYILTNMFDLIPQGAAHVKAVFLGQHYIQQDQVRIGGYRLSQAVLSVIGLQRLIARPLEIEPQDVHDILLVLHDH